jgi:cystathionine gamma-lyase/cystathionine gamma-lyase/homocysteine desulfhydrase
LECGANISLHSATKFMSGHSDVMGGIILTNDVDINQELKEARFYSSSILSPHSAWLLRRSLQTLELRLTSHCTTTKKMKD